MAEDTPAKEQRIRDPVHGLIVFAKDNDFDRLIWRLLNAPEFQRLRRIKQLGFSELVYPGATHSRFSHSVGVFHTARALAEVIKRIPGAGAYDAERAKIAVCAALLHDLGHGPFSHAFEGVLKGLGEPRKHEKWTVDIIRGATRVGEILAEAPVFRESVAQLLEEEHPTDVYSAVVSSQFDADRLDYLRRDKLMTGTEQGGFDWEWLMNNLEIEDITGSLDGGDTFTVKGLILGRKAKAAAEGYLLGRFHLYTQVYFHKTTRAAEKMLDALLRLLAVHIRRDPEMTGLSVHHPLRRYFALEGATLENYLLLDDSSVWGALPILKCAPDQPLAELAARIMERRLYKCIDIGEKAAALGGGRDPALAKFRRKLNEAKQAGDFGPLDVLEDDEQVSAYGDHAYEGRDALKKVMIKRADGRHVDLRDESAVVKSLERVRMFRVYARDNVVKEKLEKLGTEVGL